MADFDKDTPEGRRKKGVPGYKLRRLLDKLSGDEKEYEDEHEEHEEKEEESFKKIKNLFNR